MEPIIADQPGDEQVLKPQPACKSCTRVIAESDRFCPHCGTTQFDSDSLQKISTFSRQFKALSIYYFLVLLICLLIGTNDSLDHKWLFYADLIIALWTIGFAITQWRQILPLYSLKGLNPGLLILFSGAAVLLSLAVGYIVENINTAVFEMEFDYFPVFQDLPYRRLLFILSLAVYPAIIEELAFRGYFYNAVNSFAGARNAIILSSVAFAIIHVSVISLFWLIPFSLAVGYLRYRYNTLWYGMFIHFFFNLTVALKELNEYGLLW